MRDGRVELRGESDKWVIDVVDAVSNVKRLTRMEVVNMVLSRWARAKLAEANVVQRVMRGNPMPPEPTWPPSE